MEDELVWQKIGRGNIAAEHPSSRVWIFTSSVRLWISQVMQVVNLFGSPIKLHFRSRLLCTESSFSLVWLKGSRYRTRFCRIRLLYTEGSRGVPVGYRHDCPDPTWPPSMTRIKNTLRGACAGRQVPTKKTLRGTSELEKASGVLGSPCYKGYV